MNFIDTDLEMQGYELDNFKTFVYYALRLKSLATTMYKWENLPKSIDKIFLENSLLLYGNVRFAKDDVTGELVALPATFNGQLNIYGQPTSWRMYGMNGYNIAVDDTNSVGCWDNYNRTPIFRDLLMFAKRMEIIERTMDVNIEGQRTPYILSGDKSVLATLKQIYREISSNKPVIITDKNFNMESLKCTPTVTPFVAGELQIIKRNIWNEAMTFIGVDNANSEKRERLVTDEAIGNRGAVLNQRNARLKPRLEAVEAINEMFETNIEVVVNTDISEEVGVYDNILSKIGGQLSDGEQSV